MARKQAMRTRLSNGSAVDIPMPVKASKQKKKKVKQKKAKKDKDKAPKKSAKLQKGGSKVSLIGGMLSKAANVFKRSGTKDKLSLEKLSLEKPVLLVRSKGAGRGRDKNENKQQHKGKGMGKTSSKGGKLTTRLSSRNSAPDMFKEAQARQKKKPTTQRAASSPILVKFLPTYVNRLKAVPLSLGEKLSRWCHTSPMALYDGHPPQDHFLQFPLPAYTDIVWERQAELKDAGHACEPLYNPEDRDECVLERYPDGRHGLTPYTNEVAASPSPGVNTPSLPPPQYDDAMKTARRPSKGSSASASASGSKYVESSATEANNADARPVPPQLSRVPTDVSMAARIGSMLDLNNLDIPLNPIIEDDEPLPPLNIGSIGN